MHLKSSTDDYLDISGHVVYLEKVLNDALCPENRKIYLDTMDPRDSILLYYKEAGKATYMYKKTESKSLLLYHKGEGYNEPSIIIKVPTFLCTSLNNDEDDYNGENLSKIRTIMNIYKPAGRKYSIELYSIQL